MAEYFLTLPISEEETRKLRIGDVVYLSGIIYTARDMAHLKLKTLFENNQPLPYNFEGEAVFHAGPVCLKENDSWNLNVSGPTTSIRMEPYAEFTGTFGVRFVIGKGGMGEGTREACKKYGYVYLQAAPGCAAKLAQGVRQVKGVTWFDLGMPEAIWKLEVSNFGPLVVGMDTHGESIYSNVKQAATERMNHLYQQMIG